MIRDQNRAPLAEDELTFALTANVTEQIPIASCRWYLLGCQVQSGIAVCINKVGAFGRWRLPRTTGLVSRLLWDVCHNTVRATLRGPGTCSCRANYIWK